MKKIHARVFVFAMCCLLAASLLPWSMRCTVMKVEHASDPWYKCTQVPVNKECIVSENCLDITGGMVVGKNMLCCYGDSLQTLSLTCEEKLELRVYYPHWYFAGVYTFKMSELSASMGGHVYCTNDSLGNPLSANFSCFLCMVGLGAFLFSIITLIGQFWYRSSYEPIPRKMVEINV